MKNNQLKEKTKHILTEYNNCTFCGSKTLKIKKKKKIKDNFYLQAVRNDLNLKLNDLDRIKIYECKNCKIIQNNPWFTEKISRRIYSNIYGQHNRGWTNLINFFEKNILPNHGDLFKILSKKLHIDNYAEFNSPFMGLFINFFSKEYKDSKKEKKKLFHSCLNYLSSRQVAAMSISNLKKSKKNSIQFNNQVKKLKQNNSINKKVKKSLFVDNSSLCWGQNDNYKSVNSKSLASEIFDVDIFDVNRRSHKEFNFDLFGIFHTLDHTLQPKKILDFALKSSKYVVIYCHVDEHLEKQHLFSITNNFLGYLTRNKIYNLNITDKINKKFKTKELYFICTKYKNLFHKLKI